MKWCEHCRDHFAVDHYDDERNHKIGLEYGPTGAEMKLLGETERLRALFRDLDAIVQPAEMADIGRVRAIIDEALGDEAESWQPGPPAVHYATERGWGRPGSRAWFQRLFG